MTIDISAAATWTVGAVAVLFIIGQIFNVIIQYRELTAGSQAPGERLVTRDEVSKEVDSLRAELLRIEGVNTLQHVELRTYCQARFHELTSKVQDIAVDTAKMPAVVRRDIDAAILPVVIKIDACISSFVDLRSKSNDIPR